MLCSVPTERKSFPESLPMVKTIGCIIRRAFSTIIPADLRKPQSFVPKAQFISQPRVSTIGNGEKKSARSEGTPHNTPFL